MSQFKVEKKDEGSNLVLSFSGQVDEDASFNGIDFGASQEVVIDLNSVSAINSCGIREWIKWISSAPPTSHIKYKNCPKIIVDQINMVSGFLPENAEVESFYVPYYSDETGNEKMVLFSKGKEFNQGNVNPPASVKDETGEDMEMDVIEAKYFKFLTK